MTQAPPREIPQGLERQTATSNLDDRRSDYGEHTKEQQVLHQHPETQARDRKEMEDLLKQARKSLEEFLSPKLGVEKQIPISVFKKADAVVFLTVFKAGLGVGGEMGSGVVMTRKSQGGWSYPLAIGAAGVQFGLEIGASKVDYIMALFDHESVETFSGRGEFKIGADANVCVGPYGRDKDVNTTTAKDRASTVPILSYAMSKGAYLSVSLKGEVISVREDCNDHFYGKKTTPRDIWTDGGVTMPHNEDWSAIISMLDSYVSCRTAERTDEVCNPKTNK
jgi:lipid-binding SYLF domain-containing protein